MTPSDSLSDLLERCKRASGPDRDLDKLLSEQFGKRNSFGVLIVADRWLGIAPLTESIDVALALTERLLGHGWFSVLLDATRSLGVSGTDGPSALARHVLCALLQSLIAKGEAS